ETTHALRARSPHRRGDPPAGRAHLAVTPLPERPRRLARAASGRPRRLGERGPRQTVRPLRRLSRDTPNARAAAHLLTRASSQGAGVLREHDRTLDSPNPPGGGTARPTRDVPRRRRRPAATRTARDSS